MRQSYHVPLFIVLALAVAGGCDSGDSQLAQFEKRCLSAPGAEVCDQRYALCIAASCDPDSIADGTIECGRCGSTDGSCGYCYVFEGKSCSYSAPCSDIEPSGGIVYSTYSEALSYEFGFDVLQCESGPGFQADCMDAECRLTGETVELTDKDGFVREVPTAVCACRLETEGAMATLGGLCSPANCSSVWSTAGDRAGGVLSFVPQCKSPD
jgi:hypothetical protein